MSPCEYFGRLTPPSSVPDCVGTTHHRLIRETAWNGEARVVMDELLIARNPDLDSRLGYLLRLPLGGGMVFRTSGTWPRAKALYCYPVASHDWPDQPDIVERARIRSCQRRGAAIDLILDRSRENRSQLVFTTAWTRRRLLAIPTHPQTSPPARHDADGTRRRDPVAGDPARHPREARLPLRHAADHHHHPHAALRRLRHRRRGPAGGGGGTQVSR